MFADRREAGRRLAERLRRWRNRGPIVLGVPRGGVPVAFEVADELDVPLDVIVAHKLGVPCQPEVAVGAVAEDGVTLLSHATVRACDVTRQEVTATRARAIQEVMRRASLYRDGRERISLTGQTVIVVDDGVATGATIRAACQAARRNGAIRIVLAAPVVAQETARHLRREVDDLVALSTPDNFASVGEYYTDFHQVSDSEVGALLKAAVDRWTGWDDQIVLPTQVAHRRRTTAN